MKLVEFQSCQGNLQKSMQFLFLRTRRSTYFFQGSFSTALFRSKLLNKINALSARLIYQKGKFEVQRHLAAQFFCINTNFYDRSFIISILIFQYLGQGQEVGGRTILDEDLIQDLPIVARPGIILMPGQTLPMNFFHPTVISLMKKLIGGSKTFGVVHSR